MSSFSVLNSRESALGPRGHGRGPSNHIYRGRRCSSLLENGTSGILVHSGDAEGFSKAMESLLLNRGLRQSMGVAAARSARGEI